MAEEGLKLPIPRNEEEEDDIVTPVDPEVWDMVRGVIGGEETIYRLKVPTFTGKESVEQFIQTFQDLRDFARWPPKMALHKLRTALTDRARPYGVGTDIDGVFASLWARFGISAMDTVPPMTPALCGPTKNPRRRNRPKPHRWGPLRDGLDELPTSETARKTKTLYEAPSSPPQLVHSRPLPGEEPIVRTCTTTGHSRGTIHHKVNGGHTSRTGVVESAHANVPPARSSNQLTRGGKTSVPGLHPSPQRQ